MDPPRPCTSPSGHLRRVQRDRTGNSAICGASPPEAGFPARLSRSALHRAHPTFARHALEKLDDMDAPGEFVFPEVGRAGCDASTASATESLPRCQQSSKRFNLAAVDSFARTAATLLGVKPDQSPR
jgi:hypothetical protein